MGTEEIALGLGEEAFNKGIVMETIDVPDIVLENAKKQVYYEYYTTVKTDDTKCNFSNWRITSLEQCYTYDNLEGMVLPVYQMDFSFWQIHRKMLYLQAALLLQKMDGLRRITATVVF